MKIGILGALDAEVALLVENMQVERKTEDLGTAFYSGELKGCPVVVAVMGIGKINAALCTAYMIREMGAEAIVNVGIAGAMGEGLGVMDVVVSSEVLFHDTEPLMVNYYPFRARFEADAALRGKALEACGEVLGDTGHQYRAGLIATGDQFIASAAQRESINARFAPDCVEMEGAAVGQAAFVHDVPFLVIRTMSDSADDEAEDTYDNFMGDAANQSAAIVMHIAHTLAGER